MCQPAANSMPTALSFSALAAGAILSLIRRILVLIMYGSCRMPLCSSSHYFPFRINDSSPFGTTGTAGRRRRMELRRRKRRPTSSLSSRTTAPSTSPFTVAFLVFIVFTTAICHAQLSAYEGAEQQQQHQRGGGADGCTEYWQFPCEDGVHCIARYDQCDGIEQCPDASDEKNCQMHERPKPADYGRYTNDHEPPPSAHGGHQQKSSLPHGDVAAHQSPATTAASPPTVAAPRGEKRVPMELLLAGAAAFVLVAALVHGLTKLKRRRRATGGGSRVRGARAFRKGESLVDDEDDLLISQMYG